MKKLFFTLIMVVCATFAFAQTTAGDPHNGGGSRDTHDFTCMSDVAFSQVPVEYNGHGYCNIGYSYSKVAEDYTASAPFHIMRFWGVDENDNMQTTETFLIELYNGVPGAPGTIVTYTFNVTTNPIITSYDLGGDDIYMFEVDFQNFVTQLNGWMSISRTTIPYTSGLFGWLSFYDSGNALSYQVSSGNWVETGFESGDNHETFFCLGGTEGYHDFVCMNESYFSQIPDYYTNAQYCDFKYIYTKAADNYTANYPFSNMRFWGVDDVDNNMQPVETFLIEFWNGVPGAGGAVVKSYNVSIVPVLTPYVTFGLDIYQFDVNFGETITQLTGWVSISRTTASSTGDFAWLINNTYGNSISLLDGDGWESVNVTPFFCLGVGMHDFVCMDDAVFGQVPDIYDNGYYCDAAYAFSKVADDYTASAPLSSMRFWGVENENDIQATETFLIEFYNGKPGQPGVTVVQAFNVTANPVLTPYQIVGLDIYQIDVDFPVLVSQINGWVSVSRTTTASGDFAWLTLDNMSGEFVQYYSPGSGTWSTMAGYQFFCLGPVTPTTPVANWALYLGIGLILAFTVIRLRRIF